MTIYFLAAVLPLLFELIFEYTSAGSVATAVRNRRIRICLLLSAIPMFMILGLRGHYVGSDTIQYVMHFQNVRSLSFTQVLDYSGKNEPVLYLLMFFCSKISSNPNFFLSVVALIMTLCFYFFVSRIEDGALLATFFHVALGSFLFMVTGMRQGIAISFCILALDFARNKKLLPFLLILVVAFYTHRSSIMFVVVYFMANRKLTFYNFALLALATLIFIVFLESFQSWFNDAIDYDYDMEATGNGGIFLIIVVLMNILALVMSKQVLEDHPGALVLYNTSHIALILWIARLFTRTAERPSYYFLPATFAVTAIAIHKIKRPHVRLVATLAAAVLSVLLLYHRLSSASSLNQFMFFWEM